MYEANDTSARYALNITTENLKVLLSDAAVNTPVIIRGVDGKDHRIGSVRYETIRELAPVVEDATLETGHETIETRERNKTQLIIQLL